MSTPLAVNGFEVVGVRTAALNGSEFRPWNAAQTMAEAVVCGSSDSATAAADVLWL